MDDVDLKLGETPLRRVYYAAEAYYKVSRNRDKLISMEILAPELMAAKSVNKIQAVCERYELDLDRASPKAKDIQSQCRQSPSWRYEIADDLLPSYYLWVYGKVKEVSAIQVLYAVCLPIARGETDKSDTANMFDLLYHAHKAYSVLVDQVKIDYEWIPRQDIRKAKTDNAMYFLPRFPLIALFEAFQTAEGEDLQEKYGVDLNATSKHEHYYVRYWDNTAAEAIVRDALWSYTMLHRAGGDQYILDLDAQGLAKRYIEILDRYVTENAVSRHQLVIDSVSRTSKLITGDLGRALYLWQITQLQGGVEYVVCKMCGRLFPLGSQKSKTFCLLHSKSNRQYFNRKTKEKEAETAAAIEKANSVDI